MKKSFPAALVCAAALLIPSTAYACPTDCSTSGDDSATQLDVKDHASTQVDTDAAKKEVERARSFMDAGADQSQDDLDCFLSKVLEGSYYDTDSRTVRTDDSARVSEDLASSQSGRYDASWLARWLYEHEDTWQSITEDYEVGDLLSFSVEQSATSRSSSEFFASIKIVAVYVGDGRVIYCANDGSSTQIKEESIAVLEAELNLTVTLASRPCDVDNSSAAPSESATDRSCQRTCQSEDSTQSESSNTSTETSQDSSQSSSTNSSSESTETSSRSSNTSDDSNNVTNESSNSSSSESSDASSTSSESTDTTSQSTSSSESSDVSSSESSSESSNSSTSSDVASSQTSSQSSETSVESSGDSSVVAPAQSSSTTAPSSSSSSSTKSSSSRPSSLPRTGAGALLPVASIAVVAAAAGGSILARRRSRV